MSYYKIIKITENTDEDSVNQYSVYKNDHLIYSLEAYKDPILLEQDDTVWLINYSIPNTHYQIFTDLISFENYIHDIDAIYWNSVELLNNNKFLLIKGSTKFCSSIKINIIYDVRNMKLFPSKEYQCLDELLDENSLIDINGDTIECYQECGQEKIIFKTYLIINDEFIDQKSHEDGIDIITKYEIEQAKIRFKPENLKNISKFLTETNIFKQWLQGNTTGSTIVNNSENSHRLLNETQIEYIECLGHYSRSNFNSNIKYFLNNIELDNIVDDLSPTDTVVSFNQQGYYKVQRNNILYNRTLADQIQLITCSRIYHSFTDKTKVWCPSTVLNNIGLEFIFHSKDYKVTFLVEVFLEKFTKNGIEMSIFQSTNPVKITIY